MKQNKKNKAIFWDRDGVINKVVIREDKVSSPWKFEEFKITAGAVEVLNNFKKQGFLNIIFTNQPDVSRGFLKLKDLEKMHNEIEKKFLVDEIKTCSHDNHHNCKCRKPKPGMILDAAKKWDIDLKNSYVVGDSWKDIDAGRAAGCKTVFLVQDHNKNCAYESDFRINNLKEIIKIIKI